MLCYFAAVLNFGLRDYSTGEWKGGDPNCDHVAPPRGGIQAQLANGERTKIDKHYGDAGQFKTKCKKCGAKRIDKQIGLEETLEEYIARLVEVSREVRRVLHPSGTFFLNIGDSYSSFRPSKGGEIPTNTVHRGLERDKAGVEQHFRPNRAVKQQGIKHKDLCGIPWTLALALRADGWYLRADIIWHKPSTMPSSVSDRPTTAHEYIFLLSKSPRYFFDNEAVKEKGTGMTAPIGKGHAASRNFGKLGHGNEGQGIPFGSEDRNIRSVWTITSEEPYKGSHFAVFPPKLPRTCIKAGTSKEGCCPKCLEPWQRIVKKARKATRPAETSKVIDAGGRASSIKVGNRDLERHVTETRTVGWRPGCKCYKVKIIKDPPRQGQDESNLNFGVRSDLWQRKWAKLRPIYDTLITIPCTVLDPFLGSGTTAYVAVKMGRKAIGIELNPKYIEQHCAKRIRKGEFGRGTGL